MVVVFIYPGFNVVTCFSGIRFAMYVEVAVYAAFDPLSKKEGCRHSPRIK
jgi:hypothetical protein